MISELIDTWVANFKNADFNQYEIWLIWAGCIGLVVYLAAWGSDEYSYRYSFGSFGWLIAIIAFWYFAAPPLISMIWYWATSHIE